MKEQSNTWNIPGLGHSFIRNWCPCGIWRLLFFESPSKYIGNVKHVIGTDCRARDAAKWHFPEIVTHPAVMHKTLSKKICSVEVFLSQGTPSWTLNLVLTGKPRPLEKPEYQSAPAKRIYFKASAERSNCSNLEEGKESVNHWQCMRSNGQSHSEPIIWKFKVFQVITSLSINSYSPCCASKNTLQTV